MLSILYQMPFSLLKSAMWLRGYSRLKKVGLGNKSVLFLLARTCEEASRHPDYNRAPHSRVPFSKSDFLKLSPPWVAREFLFARDSTHLLSLFGKNPDITGKSIILGVRKTFV